MGDEGEARWSEIKKYLEVLDDAIENEHEIKIDGKTILMNKGVIESAFGKNFQGLVFETEDNTQISVYKRTCQFCRSNVTMSKHCKNDLNWHFCNECFKKRPDIRDHLFKIGAVIHPFTSKNCRISKCSECEQHKKWRDQNRQNSNIDLSDSEESSSTSLDLPSDSDSESNNVSFEAPEPETEQETDVSEPVQTRTRTRKRKRLVRRDSGADSMSW